MSLSRGGGRGVWHWGATAGEGHDRAVCPSEGPRRQGCLEAGEEAQARNPAEGSSGRKFTSPVLLACVCLVEQREGRDLEGRLLVSRVQGPTAHLLVGTGPAEPTTLVPPATGRSGELGPGQASSCVGQPWQAPSVAPSPPPGRRVPCGPQSGVAVTPGSANGRSLAPARSS